MSDNEISAGDGEDCLCMHDQICIYLQDAAACVGTSKSAGKNHVLHV